MDIVIGHKDEIVLDILEPKCKSHSHTKRAVIVVIESGNERRVVRNETRRFHKLVR